MGLETSTFISGLNAANPLATDPKSQGDDHLRLVKGTLLATFPGITGAVTATQTELNYSAGVTSAVQTQLGTKVPTGGALGTPASGVLTNCTGTAAGLTAGNATLAATATLATASNAFKSASSTVVVSGATAPTAGQVLTASSSTAAAWVTPTSSVLSTILAAAGSATLANANNPIAWNWTQTTAAQTGFSIGETTASTAGAGAQILYSVGTLAGSTADPLQVRTRGVDTLRISRTGDVTVTALSGAVGGGAVGSAIAISGGQGNTASVGGTVSIAGGGGGTTSGDGGAVTIAGGAALGSSTSASGAVSITSGTNAANSGGTGGVTLTSASVGAAAASSGAVIIGSGGGGGTGKSGDVTFSTGNGGGTGLAGILSLTGGLSSVAQSGNSGGIVLTGGGANGSTVAGGPIVLTSGNGGASAAGGDITLALGTGSTSGKINFVNSGAANGTVATTLGSVGPTGSTAGNPVGWLAIKVAGVARFIPYW